MKVVEKKTKNKQRMKNQFRPKQRNAKTHQTRIHKKERRKGRRKNRNRESEISSTFSIHHVLVLKKSTQGKKEKGIEEQRT